MLLHSLNRPPSCMFFFFSVSFIDVLLKLLISEIRFPSMLASTLSFYISGTIGYWIEVVALFSFPFFRNFILVFIIQLDLGHALILVGCSVLALSIFRFWTSGVNADSDRLLPLSLRVRSAAVHRWFVSDSSHDCIFLIEFFHVGIWQLFFGINPALWTRGARYKSL